MNYPFNTLNLKKLNKWKDWVPVSHDWNELDRDAVGWKHLPLLHALRTKSFTRVTIPPTCQKSNTFQLTSIKGKMEILTLILFYLNWSACVPGRSRLPHHSPPRLDTYLSNSWFINQGSTPAACFQLTQIIRKSQASQSIKEKDC